MLLGGKTLRSSARERCSFNCLHGRSGAPGQTNTLGRRTGVRSSSLTFSVDPDECAVTENGEAGSMGSAGSVSNARGDSITGTGVESGLSTNDEGRDVNEDMGRIVRLGFFSVKI